MIWVNIFHAYQPPGWDKEILTKVAAESYRPFFEWLAAHPRIRLTLNISGSLTEQLDTIGARDIVKAISGLAGREQIELTGSAMYHPILPLLPDSVARRQILQNTLRNHDLFGDAYAPRGFFPPELAFRQEMGRTIADSRFSWIVLDEIALDGTLGNTKASALYQMAGAPLYCFFRNRLVSDYLFFSAPLDNPSAFWRFVDSDGNGCGKSWPPSTRPGALLAVAGGGSAGNNDDGHGSFATSLVCSSATDNATCRQLGDAARRYGAKGPLPALERS